MYERIPDELKELEQWCCFRVQERNGKKTKIPVDAHTGKAGKSNDSSTWADYETALAAIETYKLDGLGFYFKEPYFGIDIDGVGEDIQRYLKDDTENNIVAEFIDMMESYSEISLSGNGIHIIAKGDLPTGARRKGNIEMYDSGRFFVMTGNQIGRYDRINEDDYGKVNYLHHKYLAKSEVAEIKPLMTSTGAVLPESEIIRIASNSKNGSRIKAFLQGGWEPFYTSASEADMAFANDLAFWTNRDFHMMDSIYRQSSLYREKWDRPQNESTYGIETLTKAIDECRNTFNPSKQEEDFNLYVLEETVKPVKRKYFSYDDTGNAQRFYEAYKEVTRFSYTRKNWYFYNGKIWVIDQEGKVKSLVDGLVEQMKKEPVYVADGVDEDAARKNLQKHIKYSRGSNGKTNMLKEAQHLLPIQVQDFDKDLHLFNVQNGYIDLKAGKLLDHDKEKYFSKISTVEFTDKIDCPLWEQFLDDIFEGDTELIKYIQRAIGYSLSGTTEEQVMFILFGSGRNGKSVFLDIIGEIFGSYAINIQPQTIMVKQQTSGATSDIARLDGARFVTTTEPNEGVRLDEGLVKQLTGSDKVTARRMYESEFEFIPQFKLWMATNHKPIIRGTDEGIWRRLAVIPFNLNLSEDEMDKHLKNKLKRELTAILNWAVEGYMEWQRIGLKEPQAIRDQRQEYRLEMDSVEAFIEDMCTTGATCRDTAKTLYAAYREWASTNGQYMMSSTKFGREMAKKYPKLKSSGTIHYKGVRLKSIQNDSFTMNY